MAEVIPLESKPVIYSRNLPILYTKVEGEVSGDRFTPAYGASSANVKVLVEVPELEYEARIDNPLFGGVYTELGNGTKVKEVGQIFENRLVLNELAPEQFQQNPNKVRDIALSSTQETIKSAGYVDATNLTPNKANTPESVGDLKSQATPRQSSAPILRDVIRTKPDLILTYPSDMADNQDKIKFTIWEYSRSITNQVSNIPSPTKEPYIERKDKQKVFLPITNKIQDGNSVVWSSGELNEFQRELANTSLQAQNGNFGSALETAGNLLEYATNPNNKFGNMVKLYLAGQAVGVGGLLTRATGAIFNPNLELLFQGPALRDFSFGFQLIGKRKAESTQIKKIIKFFKENMAVRDNVDNFFLNSPFIFGIEYQKGNSLHPSINRIKKCALLNCSVDYTPMGSYMTYNDPEGSMFMYSLTLQFRELTPIYSSDYDDHPIGY